MKATDKIGKMEDFLSKLTAEANNINTSSKEYAEHIDLILRLQETIFQLKALHRHQAMMITPE